MLHHKKPIVVITLLLSVVIFVATTAMKSQDDKPEWKNLKVLPKNITKDELDKVMHDWSAALGQHCGFCHARDAQTNKTDFASDAKPEKLMARKMMAMTAKINKKYFKEDGDDKDKDHAMMAVSCYTCHNGKAQPETVAPKGMMGGEHHSMAPGSGTPPPPPPAQN